MFLGKYKNVIKEVLNESSLTEFLINDSLENYEIIKEEWDPTVHHWEIQKFKEILARHHNLVNHYEHKVGKSYPNHDLDKLRPDMIVSYTKGFVKGRKRLTDEEWEEFKATQLKHYRETSHHLQYWDKSWEPNSGPINVKGKMPDEAIIEMCADWCAMSYKYGSDPYEWTAKHVNKDFLFDQHQIDLIYNTLNKMWTRAVNNKDNMIKPNVVNESLQNNSKLETNKPITIIGYHGTMNDFDNFDKKFAKNGFYFASKQRLHSLAGYYAQENGYIIKAKLHFKHPFVGTPVEYQDLYNNHYKEMMSKYDGIITVNDGSMATNSKYYNYKTDKTEEETLNIGDIVEMVVFNPKQIEIIKKVKLKDLNESAQNKLNDNFWKWFGKSYVKDINDKPIKVYHGTHYNFNEFEPNISSTSINDFPSAIYFSSSKAVASTYGNVIPCYIKLENPYIDDAEGQSYNDYYDRFSKLLTDAYHSDFYDGMIVRNLRDDWGQLKNGGRKATTYVVFNPNQIKAVNNNGEWNSNSNNIYENKLTNIQEDIKYLLSSDVVEFDFDSSLYSFILTSYKEKNNKERDTETFYFSFQNNKSKFIDICRSLLSRFNNEHTDGNNQQILNQLINYKKHSISKIGIMTILNAYYGKKLISQLNETIVYAGSGNDYEKPSLTAVGTGEGQIAHGYGLYYAIDPEVAKGYAMRSAIVNADIAYKGNPIIQRDGKYYINNEEISEDKNESLYILIVKTAINGLQSGIEELKNDIKELIQSIKDDPNSPYNDYKKDMIKTLRKSIEMSKYMTITKKKGIVHRVEIPDDKYFMNESRFYDRQSSYIQQCLKNVIEFLGGSVDELLNSSPRRVDGKYDGIDIYDYIKMLVAVKYSNSKNFNSAKYASMVMLKFGIKGIKYNGRQDGICYVLFNPNDAKVLDKQINENIKISH